jgi:DNA-binding MarR family transcriptional regulator
VLRFLAEGDKADYPTLLAWIQETFHCKERAAKDAVSILVKGGWVDALRLPSDRRRKRYLLTEKGRADMQGSFSKAALQGGRRRHSTCLNAKGRRRQAARFLPGKDELVDALEAEARRLFAGRTDLDLIQSLAPHASLLSPARRCPSRFRTRLRAELLGHE